MYGRRRKGIVMKEFQEIQAMTALMEAKRSRADRDVAAGCAATVIRRRVWTGFGAIARLYRNSDRWKGIDSRNGSPVVAYERTQIRNVDIRRCPRLTAWSAPIAGRVRTHDDDYVSDNGSGFAF